MIYNRASNQIATLIFKVEAMALRVALLVLNIQHDVDMQNRMLFVGIGLACIAIVNLNTEKGSSK